MSDKLRRFIKRNPHLASEYRKFIVKAMVDLQRAHEAQQAREIEIAAAKV